MTMAVVVPGEELLTVSASVFDAAKALREVGTVLERLELRLGEWVVVADIRSAVGLGHFQVDQQLGHGLGAHAGAAVCMQRERARAMFCLATVSAINCSASCALSRGAIIQPTT